MTPLWLDRVSWIAIVCGIVSALIVLGDILNDHPQEMKVMTWVWPLTCLYAGPLGLWAYWKTGRKRPERDKKSCPERRAA